MAGLTLWQNIFGITVIAAPAALLAIIGVASLIGRKLSEQAAARGVMITTSTSLIATLGILAIMLNSDNRHVVIGPWNWVSIHGH